MKSLYIILVIFILFKFLRVDSMSQIDTLKNLLERDFALVLSEVSVLKKNVDIICSEGKILTAIVVKHNLQEIPEAIGTSSYCRQGFHRTYIALPENVALTLTHEKKILQELGIGLISFSNETYAVILESKNFRPDKETLNAVSEKMRQIREIRDAADIYKALGHPTRLEIYLAVSKTGESKLKEIAESCGGCYPLIMKHVSILEQANLIVHEKKGHETTLKLKSAPLAINDILHTKKFENNR